MKYIKSLVSTKTNIFLIILIFCLIIFVLNFQLVFGFGDSMLPTLEGGKLYLCKNQKEYEVGDIVLYEISGLPIVHRIMEKNNLDDSFSEVIIYYTKGDNNQFFDPLPLTNTNIKCKILTF